MPRRDPQTGKFVSGGGGFGGSVDRMTTISGGLSGLIPAADLAGGVTEVTVDGEDAEIVNLSKFLDSDETFEVAWAALDAYLGLPTTATAESSANLTYELRTDLENMGKAGHAARSSHYGGSVTHESGIADMRKDEGEDSSLLYVGSAYAEPSHSDTTNGLAAGSDSYSDSVLLPIKAEMLRTVRLDEDDEVMVASRIGVDNISDHAVVWGFGLTMHGAVTET